MDLSVRSARRYRSPNRLDARHVFELNFPNAVNDDRDFFDRLTERSQIHHAFDSATGKPIVILGERRIGKTSLLNVSVNWLNAQPRYAVVFPAPWSSLSQFKLEFLSALAGAVGVRLRQREWIDANGHLQLASAAEFVAACRETCAASPNRRFVVCIDEFDSHLLTCAESERDEIQRLAFYLVEKARLPITLFFTMTQPTEKIGQAYPTSFLNKSEQVHLHPFSRSDMATMVVGLLGDHFAFDEDGLDHLFHLSGGHPYFVKALLDSLVNPPLAAPHSTTIDRGWLDRAMAQAVERAEVQSSLPNLLETHFSENERSLLARLAQAGGKLAAAQMRPEWLAAMSALAKRDYVLVQPGGDVALRIHFWRFWLNAQPSPAPLLDSGDFPDGVLIDEDSQRVFVGGAEVKLTGLELRLMMYLGRRLGHVVNRDELAESVWGKYDEAIDNSRIDQAIARIRKKLGDDARHPKYLETRAGTGYLLRDVRFMPRRS